MPTTSSSRISATGQKQTVRKGFTLIELLVVIAIISILAAILFPVFGRARENARRSSCQSNLKQIALGFIQYYQDYDERFPMSKGTGDGANHWAHGSLQPYLKSKQVLRCPSDTSTEFPGGTHDARSADSGLTDAENAFGSRVTSYGLNGLLLTNTDIYANSDGTPKTPTEQTTQRNGYTLGSIIVEHLAGVPSPASVILLAESPDRNNLNRNYFHSFRWNATGTYSTATAASRCSNNSLSTANDRFCQRPDGMFVPEDIATERHLSGANYAYLDGHVKWHKWSQVYPSSLPTVAGSTIRLQGNFDPRNGA